jgi:hypothetical protein
MDPQQRLQLESAYEAFENGRYLVLIIDKYLTYSSWYIY